MNFEMKDISEASYAISINIHKEKVKRTLELSQKASIKKHVDRFRMNDCSPIVTSIMKEDKFSLNQYPQNTLE